MKKGFTLIEILISMAIIAILSGAVLVSISSQRQKARATRVVGELSALIQPMFMCKADGGTVNWYTSSNDICSIGEQYGKWPDAAAIDPYDNFQATGANEVEFNKALSGDPVYNGGWFFTLSSGNNGNGILKICCNRVNMGCFVTTNQCIYSEMP